MLKPKTLTISYLFLTVCLFLYSYTQVDLNLTISQWSIWQVIQKAFQYIGWFQRPLSTTLYTLLLALFFTCYFAMLQLVKKGKLTQSHFWHLIIPISVILLFSYNAFSYDLFNYMFDARIITLHHLSPYGYKALDFPQDPWVNFMRWTHRTYPYGSVWLALTVPLSFIGLQYFLPTLFLFKALMVGSFLGTVYFIGKILEKVSPSEKLFGMAFFALNPLVIFESLVSAHNDIVMMFFAMMGTYFLIRRKYVFAYGALWFSAQTKFINDGMPDMLQIILPILMVVGVALLWGFRSKIENKLWNMFFFCGGIGMIIAMIFASGRTELQPWYFIWPLSFAALLVKRWEIVLATIPVSIGLLLHYVPFLYTGNWDPPIPTIKLGITGISIALGLFMACGYFIFLQQSFKRK